MPTFALRLRRSVHWLVCGVLVLTACSAKVTAPPEPPLIVRRGDEAFRYKDYDTAITVYRRYLDQTEKDQFTARVLYKVALAHYRLERYEDTLTTLDEIAQRYPDDRWVQVEALRGDAERALGHPTVALQAWDSAWRIGNDNDRQKLRPRIVTTARSLDDVELTQSRRLVTADEVEELLDQQIAKRQPGPINEPIPEAEAVQPEEVAAGTGGEEPGEEIAAAGSPAATYAAREKAEPLPDEEAIVRGEAKVGCVLPMTGSDREFGERSLRGITLVFGEHNDRLVVKDTGSDPASVAAALDELARDPEVLLVLGPVRSDDAAAIAPRAERAHLPTLLLSQREGLDGKYVVQAGMTRAQLVRELLDYAMTKVRMRRFGVLYPDDTFGKEFVATFRTEVERRGGTVVGTDAYAPDAKTFTVALVRRWRDEQNLQALFLPDSAATAARFAKFLQRDMPDITLLGVQGWEELATTDGSLNGVLFADGFYARSARPDTRDFVDRFERAYSSAPSILEAQAYDAAVLAKHVLDAGANSRATAMRQLHVAGPVEGATGELSVTPDGLRRNPFLLQVYRGKLREIGAPEEHAAPTAVTAAEAPPPAPVHAELPAPHEAEAPVAASPEPHAVADAAEPTAKVACLLPLTGPDRAYGKRALAGLRLAFADAPEQLLIRDTGGDPLGITDLLQRLKSDPKVIAVIGPLRTSEAEVAAPLAEREQMPVLLLSQRDGLAGRFALQAAMTRPQQVRLLVRYAVDTLKVRRFGVLHPNDGYGNAFVEAFNAEVAAHNATVVGTHAYEPGETDFGSAMAPVSGWDGQGLDAVFIPDGATTATALAAHVRGELPNVALLGTEAWNDPMTLAAAGSSINGAVFADAFFAESSRPSTRTFVERFQRGAGRLPTVFEAQAFDAGMVLRRVIADGATTRDQVIAQLTGMGSFEGAGELRASPTGFQRALSILSYRDGKLQEVTADAAGG